VTATPILLQRDPRVRSVRWADLRRPTRLQTARELCLTLPWLAASLALAHAGRFTAATACSFVFFLAGIRQAHGAQHQTLGLSRRANDWALFVLSIVMLGSMHAVQITHRRHHARCMGDDDVEGFTARLPWWGAIAAGPLFTARILTTALAVATPTQRRWVRAETAASVAIVAAAVFAPLPLAFGFHVAGMLVGHALTGFFLVWVVHRGCDREREVARTLRHRLGNVASMSMFFHLEHHLFPDVPTCNLAELARRLDEAAPELQRQSVFG
jgi:fatty acid desaturase